MASTASNVLATSPGVTGCVRNAPLGTTGPTNASTALSVTWKDLGYVGEDGITEAISRDVDKKKSYGGATVKTLQTDYENTFKFAFLESANADVLKRVFGADNVTVAGDNITIDKNKKVLPHEAWCFDHVDGSTLIRQWVPDGQITEVSDVVFVHSDVIAYEVTIEAFESPAINGSNSREFRYSGAIGS